MRWYSLFFLAFCLPLRGADLVVSVQIDGESQLVIQRDRLFWDHVQFDRPGRAGYPTSESFPTLVNGYAWYPGWPSTPNNSAGPSSGLLASVNFSTNGITMDQQAGRGQVTIVQQPTADNDFRLIVDFDDTAVGGADQYTIILHGVDFP